MSCSSGKCNCGSDCQCGSSCNSRSCNLFVGSCKTYTGLAEGVTTTTKTVIMGVAPSKGNADMLEGGATAGAENGCPFGDNCKSDPCTCGK